MRMKRRCDVRKPVSKEDYEIALSRAEEALRAILSYVEKQIALGPCNGDNRASILAYVNEWCVRGLSQKKVVS